MTVPSTPITGGTSSAQQNDPGRNGDDRLSPQLQIWLATVGEPLPTDTGDPRLHRTGMLADELAARGHQVTWWTSTFDHFNRVQRTPGVSTIHRDQGSYRLVVLKGPGYQRNMSPSRHLDHAIVAGRFGHAARKLGPPDIILSSLPTLELCEVTRRLAARCRIPYLIDIRDLWPDIFERSIPPPLRPLSRFPLLPYKHLAHLASRDATGIVGISEPFLLSVASLQSELLATRSPHPSV